MICQRLVRYETTIGDVPITSLARALRLFFGRRNLSYFYYMAICNRLYMGWFIQLFNYTILGAVAFQTFGPYVFTSPDSSLCNIV